MIVFVTSVRMEIVVVDGHGGGDKSKDDDCHRDQTRSLSSTWKIGRLL